MRKEEFLELSDKFQKDQCSESEKSALLDFCEKVQDKDLMGKWDLSEEEDSRLRLLIRIKATIDSENNSSSKSITIWRSFGRIAAIFLGLIAVGLLYFQLTNGDKDIIPQNAITLELEDGTIKVLDEGSSITIANKQGEVVGKQKGEKLIYDGDKSSEKAAFNILKVPYGKRFAITLSDGTNVQLNSGTSLRYPVSFISGMDRSVHLTGEAYFDVTKDSLSPFVVSADKVDIHVLGTKFNVSSYPEDSNSDIVLLEGSVGLKSGMKGISKEYDGILEPGFKATIQKKTGNIATKPVLTDIYLAWIEGELVFRNMSFDNILKKLERHYDVSITNTNEDLSKEVFNASFGNVPLRKVLQDLHITYDIDYTINGSEIMIK